MASYFDEHDCKPLAEGEQPNHLLHLIRLLIDGGAWELEYEQLVGDKPSPPASKAAVENLKTLTVSPTQVEADLKCPVCLGPYEEEEKIREMPCRHNFHTKCLLPWLQKTNTCPVCRFELPTDDETYEEYKKQKARKKQREYELDTLHNSMFG